MNTNCITAMSTYTKQCWFRQQYYWGVIVSIKLNVNHVSAQVQKNSNNKIQITSLSFHKVINDTLVSTSLGAITMAWGAVCQHPVARGDHPYNSPQWPPWICPLLAGIFTTNLFSSVTPLTVVGELHGWAAERATGHKRVNIEKDIKIHVKATLQEIWVGHRAVSDADSNGSRGMNKFSSIAIIRFICRKQFTRNIISVIMATRCYVRYTQEICRRTSKKNSLT